MALPGVESPLAVAHGVDAMIQTVTLLNDLCFSSRPPRLGTASVKRNHVLSCA